MDKGEMLSLRLQGLTYSQIADRALVSRQRVCQILQPPAAVRRWLRVRYNDACASCGILLNGHGHVHHAGNGPEENFNDLENLILLCIGCHRTLHPGHHNPSNDLSEAQRLTNVEQRAEHRRRVPGRCQECGATWESAYPARRLCDRCIWRLKTQRYRARIKARNGQHEDS